MGGYMNSQDAPNAKLATFSVTKGNRRYNMMFARSFEGKASVKTDEVPMLGRMVNGRKATGLEIKCKAKIYKCTEFFDEMIEEYKNTGLLPTFNVQVDNEDPATCMGKTSKMYNDCVIDGDVLLSMFDDGGGFIEQEIEFYAMDYTQPSNMRYKNPEYM